MANHQPITEDELIEQLQKKKTKLNVYRVVSYIAYAFIFLAIVTLSFRVLFLLFSANPNTPFVNWVYDVSSQFMKPFRGIFPTKPVAETGYLDISALFSLLMYSILGAVVKGIMDRLDTSETLVTQELYRREGKEVLLETDAPRRKR